MFSSVLICSSVFQSKLGDKQKKHFLKASVVSPPRTKPLVAMAEVDRPVMVVTRVAIRMIAIVSPVTHTHTKSVKLYKSLMRRLWFKTLIKSTMLNRCRPQNIQAAMNLIQIVSFWVNSQANVDITPLLNMMQLLVSSFKLVNSSCLQATYLAKAKKWSQHYPLSNLMATV